MNVFPKQVKLYGYFFGIVITLACFVTGFVLPFNRYTYKDMKTRVCAFSSSSDMWKQGPVVFEERCYFQIPHDLLPLGNNTAWKNKTKGLFIWRRVVLGRRISLSPEPSFAERLYEKSCPCWPSQNLALSVKRLASVVLKHLLWLPFLKSAGTLKHRPRPFFGQIYRPLRFQFICNFLLANCSFCACSYLSLVGAISSPEAAILLVCARDRDLWAILKARHKGVWIWLAVENMSVSPQSLAHAHNQTGTRIS